MSGRVKVSPLHSAVNARAEENATGRPGLPEGGSGRVQPDRGRPPGRSVGLASITKFGAGNGIRTRDPQLGKLMLYQLSYSRVVVSFLP